jgi:O-antigen/teichoic acid export membrane protein
MFKKFFWAFVDIFSSVLFQTVAVVVLARLLSPRDYGVIGTIAIFIAISNMLVDSGMGSAVIKMKSPSRIDYSTLFISNFIISILLYSMLFIASNSIADFYDIAELSLYIKALGVVILLSGLAIVQNIKLMKELRFKELAIITFLSSSLSIIFAVVLALKGFGVWALIAQQLSFAFFRVIFLWIFCRFMPILDFSFKSFRYQFKFGISIVCSSILNVIYNNCASSIVPKISTLVQNGYFVQASKIQTVPMSIVSSFSDKAIFPVLANEKDNSDMVVNARTILRYVLILAFPVITLCINYSHFLVWSLLGNKWVGADFYLDILMFSSYGLCIQYLGRNCFKALGKTSLILRLEIIKTVIGISILGVSLIWGLKFFLYGIVISSLVLVVITSFFLDRYFNYRIKNQVNDVKWVVLSSVILYLFVSLCVTYFSIGIVWNVIFAIPGVFIYVLLEKHFDRCDIIQSIKALLASVRH